MCPQSSWADFQATFFRPHHLREAIQDLLGLQKVGSTRQPPDRENACIARGDFAHATGISMLSVCSVESITSMLHTGLQSAVAAVLWP